MFAYIESRGLFAFDLNGSTLWEKDFGDKSMRNQFGEGSTPVLHGDRLVIVWDHIGDQSFVAALDTTTGAKHWRVDRDEIDTWATPLVVTAHEGAPVATEGFRMFRKALIDAWEAAGRGREGFDAIGVAYVRFAVTHPSHHRVMFSGVVRPGGRGPAPDEAGTDAFQVLVDAIVEQQQAGLVRNDTRLQLARLIWAVVHGVAMLALDGVLSPPEAETLVAFANERLRTRIAAVPPSEPLRAST